MPRPLILAHRGASTEAPENTLRAFRLALEQGADGVELDVQRTLDGIPVVIHDPTLERTTVMSGRVDSFTWAEISDVVPSLRDAAQWAAASGAWLNVEMKAQDVAAAVVAVIEEAGVTDRTIFSSFSASTVRDLGTLAPGAMRFLLSESWTEDVRRTIDSLGAAGVCLEEQAATPSAIDEIAAAELDCIVWTVDDIARIRQLLDAGVFGLITNVPAEAVRVRG